MAAREGVDGAVGLEENMVMDCEVDLKINGLVEDEIALLGMVVKALRLSNE